MVGIIATPISVQCECCNMKFFRRESMIYGNSKIYYNRAHMYRYFDNNRTNQPLDEDEIQLAKYTEPAGSTVWMEGESLPYRLIGTLGRPRTKPLEKLITLEIAILCLFLTRTSIRMSLIKQILTEHKPMTLYRGITLLKKKDLIVKVINEYKLTEKGDDLLTSQFKKPMLD